MSFRGDHAGLGENRYLSGGAGKLEWLADLPHPSCGAESRTADLPARRGRGPVGGSPSPELTPEEALLRQERQTALGTNLWGLNYLLPGIGLVLMLLGFRLLWREEIEACRGAIQMVVSVQEFDQKGGFCRSSGSNPLCITGVRVKLTGEPAGWMIFHHSLWNTAPPFHGTAAIQLCRYTSRMSCGAPPERSPAGFCTIGTGRPSGRPTTLWRRIHPPYGYQGIYGQRDIFGTFSLSTAAQHGRGYVVYAADEIPHAEYRNVPDSRFNYSYPYRFLQYPAKRH